MHKRASIKVLNRIRDVLCRIFGITVGEYHMGGKGPHIPKTNDIDQEAVKHAIAVLQPNVFCHNFKLVTGCYCTCHLTKRAVVRCVVF